MYSKLHLIRYYYTQMSIVQTEGGAFFRPLFFDFPTDNNAYQDQNLNIMLGGAMKLGI
jgi:alpha-glucosidase (family GH31 glycosyl hydrolase)